MSYSRFNNNQWLSRILLIAIIAFSGAVMYAVNEIDKIVNVQLYQYDLQFSADWANPYHSFTSIIYAGLGAAIAISAVLLLLGFIKNKTPAPTQIVTSIKQEKTATKPVQAPPQPVYTQPKTQPKQVEPPAATPKIVATQPKPQSATTTAVTITEEKTQKTTNKQNKTQNQTNACPSCKKTFSQPLVMLDFEGGKSKLVNVCPYCNQVLGDTEQKSQ